MAIDLLDYNGPRIANVKREYFISVDEYADDSGSAQLSVDFALQ